MTKCFNCDGKKFVNYVKLQSYEKFTSQTKTTVRECLICKGTGIQPNGNISKD